MAKSSEKELVEYIPKDTEDEEGANVDEACDTEAITKDEEWITKRKTELTTTRQIETRVKRQVLLEDGKVVEDSGPIVSTNTTEDTDKQETETTEKRDLGIPVTDGGLQAVTGAENPAAGQQLSEFGNGKAVTKMVPRPADGLVRQINDKLVISHEEIKDYTETEDVKHLGDFSDEAYVKAVNSGAENLQEVLLSEANQKQLIPLGPRLIANTSKSRKVIDSEDSEKRCLAQPDGKIVTEHKKTTEHEVILDEELPDKDDLSTGSREKVTTKEAHQRFYKQRDEQHVDRLVDGKVISTEMRYAADSMQMEKDSSLERPGDWDSLSDRMRKLRRTNQKSLLQQQKAALLAERKDALTKRPLDFDREEETRKGETMKWLESHFGSESTASNDSRDGDEGPDAAIEPTKKTFFNVTIKSNLGQTPQSHGPPRDSRLSATVATDAYERKYHSQVVATGSSGPNPAGPPNSRSKYYQGISNWTERKDQLPAKHFASKAFRDDLQDTIERNRLRKMSANGQAVYSSRDKLNSLERERDRYGGPAGEHAGKVGVTSATNDTYVSRDDILHQKRRQSLSLQFLNKTRRSSSRDHLDDLPEMEPPIAPVAVNQREPLHNGSFTDLRYGQKVKQEETVHRSSYSSGVKAVVGHPQRSEFIDGRAKSFERGLDMELDQEEHMMMGGRRGGYDVPKGYQTLKPTTTTSASMGRANGSDSDHLAVNGGSSTLGRPTVPQRRRAIEKKLRQQSSSSTPPLQAPSQGMATPLRKGSYEQQHRDFAEPPPDYSPPPRSRSSSPQVDYNLQRRRRSHSRDRSVHDLDSQGPMQPAAATSMSTLQRKQQQRTRFAPEPPSSSYHQQRPTMSTQTTQTIPASGTPSGHKSHSKMGQAIGNSIRKLVSKIRSASAERKMRLKRSKSREQSPSPQHASSAAANATSSTTYQQYNVIDGHIGGAGGGNTESEQESLAGGEPIGADKMNGGYHSNGHKVTNGFRRADSADPFISLKDSEANPRQRYYLGEDPYSSRLYGKENHHPYNGNGVGQRQQRIDRDREQHEESYTQQRYTSSNTLGRFQKSGGQRAVAGSTPNLHQDYYRTAQTLPRKLHEQTNGNRQPPPSTSSRYMTNGSQTLGHPDRRGQYQQATQVAVGPAKPARTYQKVLNRSKSFNVHAMNGGTDPSPIYMEKLTRHNYPATPTSNLHHSQTYKSNPHLFSGGGGGGYRDRLSGERENSLQSGLKSPSIVNLISRSQKDLSKIGHEEEPPVNGHRTLQAAGSDEKKQIFLRGLHQQAPDLYRTLHGEEVEYREKSPAVRQQLQPKYSLDSRSPIEINKDTASIMRRDSAGAHEDYYPYGRQMEGQRRFQAFKEEQRRRGSGSTIIELRHSDPRK